MHFYFLSRLNDHVPDLTIDYKERRGGRGGGFDISHLHKREDGYETWSKRDNR